MLIKFKKPDPRAGLTARMDSSRGQQLIDAGAADLVVENAAASKKPQVIQAKAPEPKAPEPQEATQEQDAQEGEAAVQVAGDAAAEPPAIEGVAQSEPEVAKPKPARGKK